MARKKKTAVEPASASYKHPEATSAARPDVGTQAQFKKRKPPKTYKYDSSLSPALEYDGKNPAREQGEAAIAKLLDHAAVARKAAAEAKHQAAEALESAKTQLLERPGYEAIQASASEAEKAVAAIEAAAEKLRAISRPFLNWSGKAERISFDVPTLPLFVHERLSTKAIIETLRGHRRSHETQLDMFDLFGDPGRPIADQLLRAYEYQDKWTNRLILGDALVVMNSLVSYENLGGQVQMIYIDPPYGVKFGSNFQPFVRKRDVKHGDDEDLTREPEMVQAYRDTWELGLHSYLTYLRDRLLLSRELLTPSGSIFVQISDENLHHVRELMDEVFGAENFCAQIAFRTSVPLKSTGLAGIADHVLWYARDKERYKFRDVFTQREVGEGTVYTSAELPDGTRRKMTSEERAETGLLPKGTRIYCTENLVSSGYTPTCIFDFKFNGKNYSPTSGKSWKTNLDGMKVLVEKKRLDASGSTLRYVLFADDYPVMKLTNLWTDLKGESEKHYVVQTASKVIQRCMLMTTDPGDLVLDPTCGSGTTAYVAELWGRRWITIDVSRVPLALARQRLLTATFPWYELKDDARGPAGGFVYKRKQNKKGEEVGGIVPHVTLKSIANNEPPAEEVLVDRPEIDSSITRVTGPFCVEATIPTPMDWEADHEAAMPALPSAAETYANFAERMLEVLRKSPLLRLEGNRTVTLTNVRPPARSLSLSAEAVIANGNGNGKKNGGAKHSAGPAPSETAGADHQKRVAIVFGPESGAVSEKLVYEAAKEANAKNYAHLYVIGFAIQAGARELIDKCLDAIGIPATYIQATPDLLMGDLLKNMRSSQIFSVCGLPEIEIHKAADGKLQVELKGLDVFDPVTMEPDSRPGGDVPCWMLDTDYNDLCFHAGQVFFPRTSAWENLRKALRGSYDEAVWDHLAGTTSAPFEPGENRKVAVKVIDDRGNELLVVKKMENAP